ncbi:tyrosine-type recombinase/integrase [Burkholderia arboris]|uniref:tyrosine-type recombinase/integrase n=1 Tax=Burkholderia arboris TaxID=488730 RepID=UPI00210AECB4|nr:tyrosine-type recombinase/integrase [Burkholderia arboris]UTV56387.1 tyrosine-type recombinase/integrase [Burkholderia arboris]UTV56447.1 tyrosine-type recombinase/integrase [Burkholderia arboris]
MGADQPATHRSSAAHAAKMESRSMKKHRERDGLLPRMEARKRKDGFTYRYHPMGKKPINLGQDRLVAIRKVLDLLGAGDDVGTIARLWEQFQETPGWQRYSQYTRNDYKQCSGPLLQIFGDMRAADIDATHVSKYLRVERAAAPVRANREAALLSNLIGLAIDRGEAKHNPCREVRRNEEQPRTEAPDPEDFQAFSAWVASLGGQKAVIGMAAEYAALAGNRKVEFLDLAWPQIDEAAGEIRVKRAKQRGKKRGEVIEHIEITPALTELIARLRAARKDDCLYVFSNRYATHYTPAGFKTEWSKLMSKALELKKIGRRFTFHDLRAYYVTRHKAERGALPDLHANPATTARVYDRTKIVKRRGM